MEFIYGNKNGAKSHLQKCRIIMSSGFGLFEEYKKGKCVHVHVSKESLNPMFELLLKGAGFYLASQGIHIRLSRNSTARGSCIGLVTVGPTKIFAPDILSYAISFTCNLLQILICKTFH